MNRADSSNLNILRSIAVLAVFVFHSIGYQDSSIRGTLGMIGVLLFFVHTSFVLMLSLERLNGESTERLWLRFMIRRVFRIYPLSIVAFVLYWAIGNPRFIGFHSIPLGHVSIATILGNLFLLTNVADLRPIPGVMWSLPYEIQMYAALPFLFFIVKERKPLLLIWAGAAIAASVASNITPLLLYVPCFIPGVMAYSRGYRPRFPSFLWPCMVTAVVGAYTMLPHLFEPIGWLLCLVLGLSLGSFEEIRNQVLNFIAAKVAKFSFGIYVFHQIFLAIAVDFWHLRLFPASIVGFTLTVCASILSYYAIENPMIKVGTRLASSFVTSGERPAVSLAAGSVSSD